jgi:acetolactate synthase regulatory subunit
MNPNDLISRMVYLQRLPLLLPKEQRKQFFVTDYQMQKVVDINMVPLEVILAHCGLWVLLNKQINCLTDITLFEHCQTMTVSGIEQNAIEDWRQQLKNSTIQSPKRIVPAGQALTFSHIWDGIDLIKNLTS